MKWAISWPQGWREKGCENRQAFRRRGQGHRKANAPHMARCGAVLQCAPRACTTGRPVPRPWADAPQKSARPQARKMNATRQSLSLSPWKALPWDLKGRCEALPFHGPFRCHLQGKGPVRSTSLSPAMPLAARFFAERLPMCGTLACQWGAHGARPAKRLRTLPLAKPLPRLGQQSRGASGEAIGEA